MEPNTTFRLDRLELGNFRCFTDCSLELDPNLTVFVAENAQGKTAILNAISIALDVFVATIAKRGAILISRETMERVKDRFEITALGAHKFKNVSALVEVFRVDREKDIEGSPVPL